MKSLLLLGSTGSIGEQTLDIVRSAPERFRIKALSAATSWRALLEQAREFHPEVVALKDPASADKLRAELPPGTALVVGPEASDELAADVDYDLAVHGIVSAAGVRPSERVLSRGKPLALANKESLVVAGAHLMALASESGATIIPVDSEHAAIFQCLRGESIDRVRKVHLTASGGPLRDLPLDEMQLVTPEMALDHPNWDMGPRISVGSATLMNKALEVIETHHLFGLEPDRIGVVVHRQSVVHSMVEFVDGSVMAQMGPPDMRVPIHHALHWPDRGSSDLTGFDVAQFARLTFEEVDPKRFPTLELGYRCVEEESDAGCVLNAADEVAVEAFLAGRIGFQDIVRVNRSVLEQRPGLDQSIEALLEADAHARVLARAAVEAIASGRPQSAQPAPRA